MALSERALASAFPFLASWLGPQFSSLAWAFWRQHPPARGDLGEWGAALPDFLRETADALLAGMASFEWALHQAERAADAVLDGASLGLLHGDPAALRLAFRPGLVMLELPREALDELAPHRAWVSRPTPLPPLQTAPQPTQQPNPQPNLQLNPQLNPQLAPDDLPRGATLPTEEGAATGATAAVLIWRKDWRGRATHLEAAAAAFMRSALAGHSLETALAASMDVPGGAPDEAGRAGWDFTVFLQQALQEQWLTAVRPLKDAGDKESHDVEPPEPAAPVRHGLPRRN